MTESCYNGGSHAAVIIVDYFCGGRKDYDDCSYAMEAAAEVGDGLVLNDIMGYSLDESPSSELTAHRADGRGEG